MTTAEYNELRRQRGDAAATAPKPKSKPRGMNGLEKSYAAHLDTLKAAGEVTWWEFEPMRLKLAAGAYYRPDFAILWRDGRLTFGETKGFFREAAKVRIKVAAAHFPFRFDVIRKSGGGFEESGVPGLIDQMEGACRAFPATHWRPLPAPPSAKEAP